jgi:hypothetical protein
MPFFFSAVGGAASMKIAMEGLLHVGQAIIFAAVE